MLNICEHGHCKPLKSLTLLAGKKEDLTNLIRRQKKESEKAGLYFNIKKTRIMTTADYDSFEIDGEKIEVMTSFTFLGSVIENEGKCDMEIKRRVAIGKAAMTGMEKIWKDKHVGIYIMRTEGLEKEMMMAFGERRRK